jgi:predicted transglutaminase-like protease
MLKEILDNEIEYEDKNAEYIASAYNSLVAVDLLDIGLMDEDEKQTIKVIQFQAINIISECLNNIYYEIFDISPDVDNDLVL